MFRYHFRFLHFSSSYLWVTSHSSPPAAFALWLHRISVSPVLFLLALTYTIDLTVHTLSSRRPSRCPLSALASTGVRPSSPVLCNFILCPAPLGSPARVFFVSPLLLPSFVNCRPAACLPPQYLSPCPHCFCVSLWAISHFFYRALFRGPPLTLSRLPPCAALSSVSCRAHF